MMAAALLCPRRREELPAALQGGTCLCGRGAPKHSVLKLQGLTQRRDAGAWSWKGLC